MLPEFVPIMISIGSEEECFRTLALDKSSELMCNTIDSWKNVLKNSLSSINRISLVLLSKSLLIAIFPNKYMVENVIFPVMKDQHLRPTYRTGSILKPAL